MAKRKHARGEKLSAPPMPIKFGSLDLVVSPPTPADMYAIRKWVRSQVQAHTAASVSSAELEGLSEADKRTYIRELVRARNSTELSSDQAMDILCTPDGVAFMTWLACRKHTPTELQKIRQQLTNENVDELHAVLDAAVSTPDDDEAEDTDPKPDSANSV